MHLTKDESNSNDLWEKKNILNNKFEPGMFELTKNDEDSVSSLILRRDCCHESLPCSGEDAVHPHFQGLLWPEATDHDTAGAG
jgi:hypothetical protein